MPACAKTPGIVPVPSTPSTDITDPYRPDRSYTSRSRPERPAPPSSPALPIFSTPTARPMSASPALMAINTVRTAVAPVAHALATLYTGIPVWPICFCSRWPSMAFASNSEPTARMPMSKMETSPSSSAASAASEARSIESLSR